MKSICIYLCNLWLVCLIAAVPVFAQKVAGPPGPSSPLYGARPEAGNPSTGLPTALRDVRLEMAHVYREVDAGRLKSQEGTRRVYVLRQIGDLIAAAEIEKRVVELEERYEQLRAQQGRPALPMRVN